jgi:NADPH:quinone reductase
VIDAVGGAVDASRIGERVWVYLAQSYRPFGTAAEFAVVPARHAVTLPESVDFEQAAGLGIPASPPTDRSSPTGPSREPRWS